MTTIRPSSPLSRRRLIKAAIFGGVAAPAILRGSSALAAYPERPVRVVVANTPGGPSDITARILTGALQEQTGKTFIVENRGGGGSNIGMGYVAHSEGDGYTLLVATNAYSVNVSLYNSIPYDPVKDFVCVSEVATSPNTFAVKADLGANTMKEFVAMAKQAPEKFNVATPPIGTAPNLQADVLKLREGLTKMASIVFNGGGDALTALLSGTVQLSSGSLGPVHPHIKSGTVKCLAVTSEQRWGDLPDVPTMLDLGYKDFVFATDMVLMAPSKTPPDVVAWLEKETLTVLKRPDVADKLLKGGFQVRVKGGKEAAERVNKEIVQFREIIAQAGIKKM
jgi:tripartite-type tricarboxylate transporter receptor subunit TctC